MVNAIRNVTKIQNKATGITGTFISQWFNTWAEQWVINVRVGRVTLSWNALNAEVL